MKKTQTYHEAGHVVANVLLNLPFESVSMKTVHKPGYIMENGEQVAVMFLITDGVIWSEEYKEKRNADITSGLLDLPAAISDMAGPQAEAMLIGKMDETVVEGASTDWKGVVVCCRIAAAPGVSIDQVPPCKMEKPIVEALSAQAETLLRTNWAAVEAVANALNDRKRLSQAEAIAIVEAHRTACAKIPPNPTI